MKRKSLKELKELLDNRINSLKESIECFKGNDNPQVKEMYLEAKVELETIENVLLYINNGNTYQFKED